MAKPELNPAPAPSGTDRAPERLWLKSYPKDVDWGMELEPVLLTSLLDQAVAAFGPLALPKSGACLTGRQKDSRRSAFERASRLGS